MSAKKRSLKPAKLTMDEMTDANPVMPTERLGSPEALIAIHTQLCKNDEKGSSNRGTVQQLMDFEPPFDPQKMKEEGRENGFNVNFGLGASAKNEALGAFVDIFTSPEKLVEIKLNSTVQDGNKQVWESIMSEEFTAMVRASDVGLPRFLTLADIFTTHGIGITFFEDSRNWRFQSTGLDEMKFPKDAEAISTTIPIVTCSRSVTLDVLYSKIDGAPEGATEFNGWNVSEVKKAIIAATKMGQRGTRYENYESLVKDLKTNQLYAQNVLPSVGLIYAWVREYNGKISSYVSLDRYPEKPIGRSAAEPMQWLCRNLSSIENAERLFHIFPYGVGHKNLIYTIRGLGYLIYEAAQADNVLRNKMMENARAASSLIYSAETVDDALSFELIDYGPVIVLPPGLKQQDAQTAMNLERNMLPVIAENAQMMDRHTGGLSSNSFREVRSRENKLATAAFLENTAKLNAFAINLFYNPWDKHEREMVRRAFNVVQVDPICKAEVAEMKKKCIDRGVPEEVLGKIDLKATRAVRVLGNGSRSNRLMMFEAGTQMFSSMDPEGQENFVYDFLSEYFGADRAERYKKRPGQRTEPVDSALAELENHVLQDGGWVDPMPGELTMVHLDRHLDELEAGMELIKNGQIDYGQWVATRLQLYRHLTMTLEGATVHPTVMPQLKEMRRRHQNIKEIIENGIKQLEASGQQAAADAQSQQAQGDPNAQANQEMAMKEQEHAMNLRHKFELIQAEIEGRKQKAAAEIAIDKQKAMAEIGRQNLKAASEMQIRNATR